MNKTSKGLVTKIQGEGSDALLEKLLSLKKYWEWADKLKDQYYFYRQQEERNIQLKKASILKRDSSMFFCFYLGVLGLVIKSFQDEPKVEMTPEVKELKSQLVFNLDKFAEAACNPGKMILTDRLLTDVIKDVNIQSVNMLHVGIGYFLNKKIHELRNKDVFPYAMKRS